jgi:peroxiredoxin
MVASFAKRSGLVLAAILALAVAAGAMSSWRSFKAVEVAPDVGYTLLDGSRSSLQQLRGKVVLVNFWATSCAVCLHEMPNIVAANETFKARGYDTLAVTMSYDPPAYVISFAERRRLPFGVAIDNTGTIAKSFGDVQFTPTCVLINKRGEIVVRIVGEPDFVALHRLIEKSLAES